MELHFLSFPILFTLLVFVFMVLKLERRAKSSSSDSTPKLPPGPWKLPIVGNIHQLAGSLPHRVLWNLAKKHGPLMHLQLGEVSTIIISSPELAMEVMKNHDLTFASRPEILVSRVLSYGSTDIAFAPYGEYWRQVRKICVLELLSLKRVQSFRTIREEEVRNLCKWISSKAGSPINFTENIFSLAYTITAKIAFGKKCKEQEQFLSVIKNAIGAAAGFSISDLYPSINLLYTISGMRSKLERLHKEADRILETIVDEHRKLSADAKGTNDLTEANEDLVDVLLKYEGDGDTSREFTLTNDNIKSVILDIFSAGSETSATTVDWVLPELIKNPKVMAKAQAEVRQVFDRQGHVDEAGLNELNYLKLVIKETLRLHPPVPMLLPRVCREKCEIKGYEIPLNARVMVNAWAIGRDPNYWTDAERFDPERFLGSRVDFKGNNFEYIPFGSGRRICPGMSFGLANVELQLASLLYHFDWKLPSGIKHEDLDMIEAFGLTSRRKEDLYVIPIPYLNLKSRIASL